MNSGRITSMFKLIIKPLGICLLAFGSTAHAAIVHLSGATVDFYYDDTQPGMVAYGPLTAVGDSIFATPSNFLAESTGVAGGNVANFSAFGSITIVAKAGYQFNSATVVQQGDYQVNGVGASVDSTGDLMITDSNNATTNDSLTMLNSGLGVNDGTLQAWSSLGQFDLTASIWDNVNSIDLSLLSVLSASSSVLGESSFIQNKLVGGGLITIETVVVPVPATFGLFISGLFGLFGLARRSRR